MTFSSNENDVSRKRISHREVDSFGTVGDAAERLARQPAFDLANDRKWVFRARIVGSDHTGITVSGSGDCHQRALALVSISPTTEDRD